MQAETREVGTVISRYKRSNLPPEKKQPSPTESWCYSYQHERNNRSGKGLANESVLLNPYEL